MRILFIGDVVGRPGREAIEKLLPEIVRSDDIDLVIVNGENAAGGLGITPNVAEQLYSCGVDVITTGNHIWKHKEIQEFIAKHRNLVRPANYPDKTPGVGFTIVSCQGTEVGVINLAGRVFMPSLDCPFRAAQRAIKEISSKTPIIIVDIHGEATSEKAALGWYLDGKASAVVGTHTHVQTADEQILPLGTAYITDVGMTGPYDSVIGMRKERVIEQFITQLPVRFEVAQDKVRLCGVVLEIDSTSGRAQGIKRIRMDL